MTSIRAVTAENIDELHNQLDEIPTDTNSKGNDGGGGYNDQMEARVTALEEAVKSLPTKADLDQLRLSSQVDASALRADFEKSRAESIKANGELRGEFEKLRGDVFKGFADLRSDLHKNAVDIQRWMIATVIGLFLGFGGLFLAMSNALKPTPTTAVALPAQQQPIIINVPAASPAPSASPQQ